MTEKEEKYTKSELKRAAKFKGKEDLIEALFKNDEEISVSEAEKRINKFMKGRV